MLVPGDTWKLFIVSLCAKPLWCIRTVQYTVPHFIQEWNFKLLSESSVLKIEHKLMLKNKIMNKAHFTEY